MKNLIDYINLLNESKSKITLEMFICWYASGRFDDPETLNDLDNKKWHSIYDTLIHLPSVYKYTSKWCTFSNNDLSETKSVFKNITNFKKFCNDNKDAELNKVKQIYEPIHNDDSKYDGVAPEDWWVSFNVNNVWFWFNTATSNNMKKDLEKKYKIDVTKQ